MSKDFNYKEKRQKLEELLDSMQTGNLSIDESFTKYTEAEKIIAELEKYLKTMQNKIIKVKNK